MSYRVIDIEGFEREDLFRLYTGKLKIAMNATVDVDVTRVLRFCRRNHMKFYNVMMWLAGRVLNAHEEFRYLLTEEGELRLYDSISPSYTDFNPKTERFVKFATEYSDDLATFHARAEHDRALHREESGFLPDQPENVYDISCLPWLHYRSLSLVVDEGRSTLYPVVIWGKYERHGLRYMMPVTFKMNHAVCDGFHLSRFFSELSEEIAALGKRKAK